MPMLRQPIVVLVGHVDHGKSSILEQIKGISITKGEAGGITQSIMAYHVPLSAIQKTCGSLLSTVTRQHTIPGLLFLDSPGHAAFHLMRKRGGNLADIAILVVDSQEGMKEQTLESLRILRQYKTPFIVAFNKIDQFAGWRSNNNIALMQSLKDQRDDVQHNLDTKLYTFVGKMSEENFQAERFDRVSDYTQQIAIVPVSAKTGEGIPELLMVVTGLAQKYLEQSLQTDVKGPGRGSVLEVTEESGLGVCLDVVLYDGTLAVGDTIIIGGIEKPFITKVRSLFLQEKTKQGKLQSVKEVHAACGVRVCAPDLAGVVGGMPLSVAQGNIDELTTEIQQEIETVLMDTDDEGITAKADTLGSLEALMTLLKEKQIPIKHGRIGDITKKDLAEAKAQSKPLYRAVIGFRVQPLHADGVKVITHDVIYKIIEDFEQWKAAQARKEEETAFQQLTKPCQVQILRGCVFRQSNPAVVGVHVQIGTLCTDTPLIKADGSKVDKVKSIQFESESIKEAEAGKEIAIALPHVIVGRQIKEDDILLSDLSEDTFKKLKSLKKHLKEPEIELLKTLAAIKRKTNPLWGL